MAGHPPDEHERQREALATARSLADDRSTLASSAMAAAAQRASDHFTAQDAAADEEGDRIELWGRRIGRALSLAAFLGLSVYLYLNYVR
jgi:hypothetical protein